MCPDILLIIEAVLERGHRLLLLTNAMRPMMRPRIQSGIEALHARFGDRMVLRISLDSHDRALHDAERGDGAFAEASKGLAWLAGQGIQVALAGRQSLHEDDTDARTAYGLLADAPRA